MKSWLNKYFILFFASLALMSCEKDEEMIKIAEGTSPVLSASSNNIVLTKENADKDALTLNWSASEFGFQAGVKYTAEIDKKGNNFAAAKSVAIPATGEKTISKAFTAAELNTLLGQLGMMPGAPADVEMRIKAEVSPKVEPIYSNTVAVKATPYLDIIEYPSLWVPGSHQGWTPGTAPKISSVNDNGVYEGYVNFTDAQTNFKFTPAPNWDNDFGGTSNGNKGTLAPKATDLQVNGAGYYLLKANTNALTWEAIKTIWGVIGDATAGGWNSDQDLTYDAATKTWKGNLNLTAGKIKFRANDDWAINLGDNDANGSLEYGGADIVISTAGQYEVILNLGIPGNYNYTLRKL